ncbi:terminase gpA endonuclease subunit [Allorhizobium undicola]|uniref:terminase gpA endonuclease subunit n=1 Tax=Allorhizobium undicola TaxID=78527 RepID=UPI000489C30D|nr:terminase gpA endonuclease subunit [Allorhizobium undicola]
MRLPTERKSEEQIIEEMTPDLVAEVIRDFDQMRIALRNEVLKIPDWQPPKAWVRENINLNGKLSQREGWLEYTGYQSALADYFMDERCKQLTILKGTRIGWSLFIASISMYIAGYLKKTVTISQPTEGDALAFFKEVIDPMIDCCDVLKTQRIPGSWDLIQFRDGGCIRLIGATSDDNFRRFDSPFNFMDEYSAAGYEPSKGSQGDKKSLFAERGGAHWHTMIGVGSSPLSKDNCRTYAEYLKSDRRYPYVTCPRCQRQQVMEWGDKDSAFGFNWTCDETTGFVKDAWYQCVGGCRITDTDKIALDRTLEYIPTSVSTTPGHYGMHIPQWLSFAGQASYKAICQRWLNSQGDPEKLKTFTNNVLASVWDEYTTSAMDAKAVSSMLRPYPAEVPDDVVVLTAGGDTQDNKEGGALGTLASRELTVVGWNALGQFRIIGHWKVLGEPGDPSADAELRALLDRPYHKRDGSPWYIQASAHDFGGKGYADEVRAFTNSFPIRRNVWAIKGNSHRKDFIWPKRKSKQNANGNVFYTIDSHLARDAIFKLLQLQGDKQSLIPLSLGSGYLDRLMCEERYRKDGKWHWRKKQGHRSEEEWMCLAYAALKGLMLNRNWKNLNLAAGDRDVPELIFDPETGEIGYEGIDKSAMALLKQQLAEQDLREVQISIPGSAKEQKVNNAPAQPMVAAPAGGQQQRKKRKRRTGGIHAYA